jgi:hypothetical protein
MADAERTGSRRSIERQQIAQALNTSLATIARTRQQLFEESFDAVLTRKHPPNSTRKPIFDGAARPNSSPWPVQSRQKAAHVPNGVVAVQVVVMIVADDRTARCAWPSLSSAPRGVVGWLTTAAMALAPIGMFATGVTKHIGRSERTVAFVGIPKMPRNFISRSLLIGILLGIALAILTLVLARWFP